MKNHLHKNFLRKDNAQHTYRSKIGDIGALSKDSLFSKLPRNLWRKGRQQKAFFAGELWCPGEPAAGNCHIPLSDGFKLKGNRKKISRRRTPRAALFSDPAPAAIDKIIRETYLPFLFSPRVLHVSIWQIFAFLILCFI